MLEEAGDVSPCPERRRPHARAAAPAAIAASQPQAPPDEPADDERRHHRSGRPAFGLCQHRKAPRSQASPTDANRTLPSGGRSAVTNAAATPLPVAAETHAAS